MCICSSESEHFDGVSVSTRTFAMLATKMLTFGNVFGHIQCSDFRDDISEPIPRKRSNGLIYLEAMHKP